MCGIPNRLWGKHVELRTGNDLMLLFPQVSTQDKIRTSQLSATTPHFPFVTQTCLHFCRLGSEPSFCTRWQGSCQSSVEKGLSSHWRGFHPDGEQSSGCVTRRLVEPARPGLQGEAVTPCPRGRCHLPCHPDASFRKRGSFCRTGGRERWF